MSTPTTVPFDIATRLVAAGISGITAIGTDVWHVSGLQPVGTGKPGKLTIVREYDGEIEPWMGAATAEFTKHFLQVECRGDPLDVDEPRMRVLACRDALHRYALSGYIRLWVASPVAFDLGPDEAKRHRFAINVEAWKE